eukprot:gene31009-41285_t
MLVGEKYSAIDEVNYHRKLPANLFTSPLYVACGAIANVVYEGVTWVPDTPYATGGGLVATTATITNPIAATERYWPAPLAANSGEQIFVGSTGVYTVTIYLAERYFKQADQRIFNINIGDGTNNKNMFATNIDLYAQLGFGELGAFSMDVVVTSSTININFVATVNNPKLSAFSVVFKGPLSSSPTHSPTYVPTKVLTSKPSKAPSLAPSIIPTFPPRFSPSKAPSLAPSAIRTISPSRSPSKTPSLAPSAIRTVSPSRSPSEAPSFKPSKAPVTRVPSRTPSFRPSTPTTSPSRVPTAIPTTKRPSVKPSKRPSVLPTASPSISPSRIPSRAPTVRPTALPSLKPTSLPSSLAPSSTPSISP